MQYWVSAFMWMEMHLWHPFFYFLNTINFVNQGEALHLEVNKSVLPTECNTWITQPRLEPRPHDTFISMVLCSLFLIPFLYMYIISFINKVNNCFVVVVDLLNKFIITFLYSVFNKYPLSKTTTNMNWLKCLLQFHAHRQPVDMVKLLQSIRVIDKDVPRTDRGQVYFE